MMNRAFTAIMKDLYGISITDSESVFKADITVKQQSNDPDWAQNVADRLHVQRFIVNRSEHANFAHMRENALLIPRIDSWLPELAKNIADASDPSREAAYTLAKSLLASSCTHIRRWAVRES